MSGISTDRELFSPDYEAQVQLPESFAPSSPATQELEEFEAYSRRALPQLVEANLQAMVNTRMVPIEEELRRLLVDVVRRCQSTVAENFRVTRPQRDLSTNSPQQPSSQAISQLPSREETFLTNSQLLGSTLAGKTSGFFEEPPHMHVEAEPSCPRPLEGTDRLNVPQNQLTDSGYGGSLEACDCNCHAGLEIDDILNGLFSPGQSLVSALTSSRQIQAIAKTALSSTLIYGISILGIWVANPNSGTLILRRQRRRK